MLHINMLSGEELVKIPVDDSEDVRSLKLRLTQLQGLPPRFRQRLLLHGENLEDTAKLDCPTSLELVLLTFADVSSQPLRATLTFEFPNLSYDIIVRKAEVCVFTCVWPLTGAKVLTE